MGVIPGLQLSQGDLGSGPHAAADLGQVISLLGASTYPSPKWGQDISPPLSSAGEE